jgi:ribose 1,5-bisphosphokinase PhnN
LPTGADNAELYFDFPASIDKWKKKGSIIFNINKEPLPNDKEQFKMATVVIELTRNILEHLY